MGRRLTMAFLPRDSVQLIEGYEKISPYLISKGAVPFFGTLLGLVRDGAPIDQDDDLDFAMEEPSLRKLANTIEDDLVCRNLIQVESRLGLAQVSFEFPITSCLAIQVDIYGYSRGGDSIIFPVHWSNEATNEMNWLRVPTSIGVIDGLISGRTSQGTQLHLQAGVNSLLEYLYGSRWEVPLRKNIDYRMELHEGIPVYKVLGPIKRMQLSLSHALLVWIETHPAHILTKIVRSLARFMPAKWKRKFFEH
jgi:hypothetical protein